MTACCRQIQSGLPVHAPPTGIKPHASPARPPIPFVSQSNVPAWAQQAKSSQHTEQCLVFPSSPSAKQLQDVGFVDVDLDSPDLMLGKSQPEQTTQASRQQAVPIPFMQTAGQGQSSTPTSQTEEQTQLNAWPHTDNTSQLAFRNSPLASPLFQPAGHTNIADVTGQDSTYTSPTKAMSDKSFAPTASSQAQTSISAFAQGPYDMAAQGGYGTASIHSGSPSIASSAPTSPGQMPNGVVPSRRSSFLPRGMSSHLHKALRATAAAASKATAAIAPPPNSSQAAATQMWQPEADALSSLTALGAVEVSQQQEEAFGDQEHVDSSPWGPSITPAAEQAGKEAPWWQKQLRNLQQNLQSQSEDGTVSEADSISGAGDASVQHQPGPPEQLSSHSLDQLPYALTNGNHSYAMPSHADPSLSMNGNQRPVVEGHVSAHTGNGQASLHEESALWLQHTETQPAFAGSPADLDGVELVDGGHDFIQAESEVCAVACVWNETLSSFAICCALRFAIIVTIAEVNCSVQQHLQSYFSFNLTG